VVRALYEQSVDPVSALSALAARLGPPVAAARVRRIEDRVWERAWLTDWSSRRFGRRLWVCPSDAAAPDAADAIVVRLDPGLAFGTGTHPTTALCLEALDALPLAGRHVLDYGSGSGILCVAALKLGAQSATAVDLDPQALCATRSNAERNGVADLLTVQGVDAPLPRADCLVANILAGTLIELAPLLTDACAAGADLLLSGILQAQGEAVLAAYRSSFDIVSCERRDGWTCLHARRRSVARAGGV
jgi:ribosomal protein L11 methyltransferase